MISYTRSRQIPFYVDRLFIDKIPVYKKEKLRFYEKYIVLSLLNGIKAKDSIELKEICAKTFNIKQSFVNDFFKVFYELGYIKFDEQNIIFHLSDKFEIAYDEQDKTIMQAHMEAKTADYSKVMYVEAYKEFMHEDGLKKYGFKKDPVIEALAQQEIDDFNDYILNESINKVIDIIAQAFKNDGSSFSVVTEKIKHLEAKDIRKEKHSIEAVLEYGYDETLKTSSLQKVHLSDSAEPLREYIEDRCKEYDVDYDLPRFIQFKETYEEQENALDLLQSLTKRNIELKKAEGEISNKISKLSRAQSNRKITEEMMEDSQREKERRTEIKEEIDDINSRTRELLITAGDNYNRLGKEMDPEIKKTYEKYNKGFEFDVYIQRFCTKLDEFLSMCLSNAQRAKIIEKASEIRYYVNQLAKAVLDVEVGGSETLSKYLESPSAFKGFSKTYKYFQQKDQLPLYEDMRVLHFDVINPLSHGAENKKGNEEKIKNFFALEDKTKKRYLLSFVKFYGMLSLKPKQKEKIMSVLNKNDE